MEAPSVPSPCQKKGCKITSRAQKCYAVPICLYVILQSKKQNLVCHSVNIKRKNKTKLQMTLYSILCYCVQEELRIKHADNFADIFSVNSSQKIYIYLVGCGQTQVCNFGNYCLFKFIFFKHTELKEPKKEPEVHGSPVRAKLLWKKRL